MTSPSTTLSLAQSTPAPRLFLLQGLARPASRFSHAWHRLVMWVSAAMSLPHICEDADVCMQLVHTVLEGSICVNHCMVSPCIDVYNCTQQPFTSASVSPSSQQKIIPHHSHCPLVFHSTHRPSESVYYLFSHH